jgi:hypothetical protein
MRRGMQIRLDAVGDRKDLLGGRNRAAAVFLNHDGRKRHQLIL